MIFVACSSNTFILLINERSYLYINAYIKNTVISESFIMYSFSGKMNIAEVSDN